VFGEQRPVGRNPVSGKWRIPLDIFIIIAPMALPFTFVIKHWSPDRIANKKIPDTRPGIFDLCFTEYQ